MALALLPAVATFFVAILLATMILARRRRSPIHWTYLALLAGILFWTGGVIWRFTHLSDAGVRVGMTLTYLGIFGVAPIWLMLAARYTRTELVVVPRPWKTALFFLLPAVSYLSFLTNDHHHLFATEISDAAFVAGPRAWGGPLFWIGLAWVYVTALAGTGLLLAHAWRLRGSRETRLGLKLAAAALAPIALSQIYIFRLLPVPYDLTPTGLCITLLIFYGALSRDGLFENLPLARRDIIEHLDDGVVLFDTDGVILDCNPAVPRVLGLDAGSWLGRPLVSLLTEVSAEPPDDLVAAVHRVLRDGDPSLRYLETRAGRRVEALIARVHAPSGQPAGAYAVLRDRTEQHRYEQVVRQAQRLESVGVLAAGVAHEVNNPLAFIQTNLGLLQQMADTVERNAPNLPRKDGAQLEEMREMLDDSLEGISRISRIVDRLRRFSRVAEESMGAVDWNEVLSEAIRFARLHRKGDLAVEAEFEPALPTIHGSRDALTQVALNLLMNAAQAVAGLDGGRITVASRSADGFVFVSIRDNGPGVPEPIRDHIFDPFFTTKAADEGTGLGLAIAYDIVREHGGGLELDPDGPGACFTLRFPVREAADETSI